MTKQEKKKVLYVITKSNWGGAGRYVYDLATNMPHKKFESVVSLGGDGPLKTALEEAGIRTIPLSTLTRNISFGRDFKAFFDLLKIFREEKPDIVHINSSKAGALGVLAARAAHIPKIIFTAHGWAFNEDRFALSKYAIKIIHWLTVLMSHKTIAVSQETKSQISSLPLMKNKIDVIHNGIGKFEKKYKQEALSALLDKKARQKIRDETLIVGTISELHKNKGLDYLIESVALLDEKYSNRPGKAAPDYIVIIVGEGEERASLEKLIQEKCLTEKIFLVGHKENARCLLRAFDIVTLTSRTEALPYALLEAGSSECPVIASAVGGVPEIIIDMDTGILIPPRNSEQLSQALDYLISRSDERKRLRLALKRHINSNFSLKKMIKNTSKQYR